MGISRTNLVWRNWRVGFSSCMFYLFWLNLSFHPFKDSSRSEKYFSCISVGVPFYCNFPLKPSNSMWKCSWFLALLPIRKSSPVPSYGYIIVSNKYSAGQISFLLSFTAILPTTDWKGSNTNRNLSIRLELWVLQVFCKEENYFTSISLWFLDRSDKRKRWNWFFPPM